MLSIWGIISIARLKTESVYVGSAVGSRWLLKADHILVKRCIIEQSLPSRERGLKFAEFFGLCRLSVVAPFAGAWIEISMPVLSPP